MTALAVNRRGACPALSSPMQTGDGLLVRLQPVSQGLTPKQFIGLCESAARHGNGLVEITARGSFQIRGLTSHTVPLLADDVNQLGIEVRSGAPVDVPPLAGLDPEEIADPRPLAEAIRAAISDAGLSRRLGPKVSVVVDGGGQIDLGSVLADLRLTAGRRRTGTIWRIAIAGDAQTAEPMGATTFNGAVGFAVELLTQIADLGHQGRAKDLVKAPTAATASTPPPPALHPISLAEGRTALPIALPFGSAMAADLGSFARHAKGVVELRLAPGRRLLALSQAADASSIRDLASQLGFITEPDDPRLGISACAGKPACASGHIETRTIAASVAADHPDLTARAGDIHISGCAKGCAHPAPAAITLVGDENGVGLVVNGTARQKPLAYTRPERLKAGLKRLARLFEGTAGAEAGGHLAGVAKDRLAAAFRQDV